MRRTPSGRSHALARAKCLSLFFFPTPDVPSYEQLIKEVRESEGQLADYNLAMDKHRTDADIGDIKQFQTTLQVRAR